MDRVDVGIIRWFLQGQQTVPFRAEVKPMVKTLSKRLGVTGETVRNRVRRMFDSGVLNGVTLQPNPTLLGMKTSAFGMYVPSSVSRPELIRKIGLIEGCQLSVSHIDGLVGVVFMHEGGESLERKVKLMQGLAGVKDGFLTAVPFPPCELELTQTDWKLMAALRPDASLSYSELSAKLGISKKTVKRRVERMVSGGAVFTMALHQVRAVKGSLEANLVVFYDEGADRAATDVSIMREIDDIMIYAGVWGSYSVYAISIPNLASAEETAQKVRKIRGVRDARASVMEERLELYECVDPLLAKKTLAEPMLEA